MCRPANAPVRLPCCDGGSTARSGQVRDVFPLCRPPSESASPWTIGQHVAVLVRRLEMIQHDVVLGVTSQLDPHHPGNDHDRIRVGDLLAQSRERAATAWDRPRSLPLLDRLERVVAGVDLRDGGHGIVVVATPDLASACFVPVPMGERVTIGAAATVRTLLRIFDQRTAEAPAAWRDRAAQPLKHPSARARRVSAGDRS
jgi:hypothetical protein